MQKQSGPARPQRKTAISRRLIRTGLLVLVASMLGVVILRQVTGSAPQTPQQRADERRERDRAAAATADPNTVRRQLTQQFEDYMRQYQARAEEPTAAPEVSAAVDQEPATVPPPSPAAVNEDAQRLEQLRRSQAPAQEPPADLWSWEAQGLSDLLGTAVSAATLPGLQAQTASATAGPGGLPGAISGSGIDTGLGTGSSGRAPAPTHPGQSMPATGSPSSSMMGFGSNGTFGQAERRPLTPTPAPSPYWIRDGWIIPAVIIPSLTTDASGTFRAMVTSDVYDSIAGRHLLIEHGTMLLGVVNTDVRQGQSRMELAVTRMDFPNGAHMRLGSWDISDATGAAGVEAHVDDHFWERFGSAFAVAGITALAGRWDQRQNVTINIGGANSGGTTSSLSGAAGQALTDTVKAILQQNQSYKRTLTLDPGDKITVVVAHDLVLPPDIVRSQR